ncbi:hypothetical protein MUK72_19160 (plasmid) [Halococcus dombrowskii]|uniref:Uncharacterized protein n=1 Tax=Halococcus dombrowskii TaxID=179637 RepID=A0AAV3SHX9_HALDO|nr:hypothetical protein [Halococcus dombrowskii]UOO97272.1 hypothetical protein MUK72_19160 [Halococcus dombrowskii]
MFPVVVHLNDLVIVDQLSDAPFLAIRKELHKSDDRQIVRPIASQFEQGRVRTPDRDVALDDVKFIEAMDGLDERGIPVIALHGVVEVVEPADRPPETYAESQGGDPVEPGQWIRVVPDGAGRGDMNKTAFRAGEQPGMSAPFAREQLWVAFGPFVICQ